MATSPFISARIPPELLNKIEEYIEATGESKTDAIVKALTAYLDSWAVKKDNSLEKKVYELENTCVELTQQLTHIEESHKQSLLNALQNFSDLCEKYREIERRLEDLEVQNQKLSTAPMLPIALTMPVSTSVDTTKT